MKIPPVFILKKWDVMLKVVRLSIRLYKGDSCYGRDIAKG